MFSGGGNADESTHDAEEITKLTRLGVSWNNPI